MTIIRTMSFTAALVCTLGLYSLPAQAQGTQIAFGGLKHDSSLPIEVTSDQLSVDQGTGKALFSGNVIIGQGAMRLSAQTVEVVYASESSESSEIARLLASGGVTITNAGEAAEAQRAEYDLESGTVVLTGNVLLTQENSALSGERMVIDLNTGTGRMDGRVKTILQSGKD
ncbi:lipopolysaccharide transport periplasmic protein LptA [Celeribacter halophilus]|uniref:Lipopolysaccharide export system protein LptA n=1 Tax=Celeribacter halophilus TaxID=576117 RepID=A0A1I3TWH4_9RHOB|nr:lipopolysaccharide transport periplasmic protein LptA [Celeribacter halophilus]PZX10734.1 lipopolysaccharide export system protein LptA [Celeribacter halophilus]SFJ74016.1 lipopolysaccharide export system protein LptA [Celeribacter halophilus]